ncbi:unnamed protein product [Clonostachys rosea f. rosea IK726]|uniref:Zn(2)-C6 fungal-type domain-containing protein n=2 Tax=Bionectria ochroleuca TaxID=29856 RepID=A0A0B7KKN0_BIOOC|nr:unnamed protein product [Clonostachys rosea f. rosea IK726]
MSRQTSSENAEVDAEADPAVQKRAASPAADAVRRPKRGKYTAVACDECKRRKLKCLPGENEDACRRCTSSGLPCVYPTHREAANAAKGKSENSTELWALDKEVKQLRLEMAELAATVTDLKTRVNGEDTRSIAASVRSGSNAATGQTSPRDPRLRITVPKQPQFVGPTRSAYSIEIGERSLTRMGIPPYEMPPPSGPGSPIEPSRGPLTLDYEFWQRCDTSEVSRLLGVFQEEVESVYPCIDSGYLAANAPKILEYGRNSETALQSDMAPEPRQFDFSYKDFQLAKVALATAIVIEAHGKRENSTQMVESVERSVSRISKPAGDVKDLQILIVLSIYYFHSDEDLLAWRTIGLAARDALEMGLHRKATILESFHDDSQRSMAARVFWVIYVLDRRWSFGTSLSFALVDRDIDPELPEPGPDYQYLKCMIGYGRLSSQLWEALMAFGSMANFIPEETTAVLDLKTQEWLESIPPDLQLRHPRLGLAARAQPRVLHRLRALLYLRGNHTRILIYRHHLLSPAKIKADPHSAYLVVEIAKDSIKVLVHLNATSDIYSRQQTAFNYFLVTALAVIFLAVCHDPKVFAEICRNSFHAAVKLVRDFSRRSQASRRLWNSIRGLLPRLKRLGMKGAEDGREVEQNNGQNELVAREDSTGSLNQQSDSKEQRYGEEPGMIVPVGMEMLAGGLDSGTEFAGAGTTPNMFQMSNDLMALFDVFEQGQQFPSDFGHDYYNGGDGSEITRRFQGLM